MWLVHLAYILITLIASVPLIISGQYLLGVAGALGPLLCWWAGSGLRGSLFVGDKSQKIGGMVAAIVFVVIGAAILLYTKYRIAVYEVTLEGWHWGLIGFVVGFLATTKKHAEG